MGWLSNPEAIDSIMRLTPMIDKRIP